MKILSILLMLLSFWAQSSQAVTLNLPGDFWGLYVGTDSNNDPGDLTTPYGGFNPYIYNPSDISTFNGQLTFDNDGFNCVPDGSRIQVRLTWEAH